DVNYRGGPLSVQVGEAENPNAVRAGDRAPDARLIDAASGQTVRLFDLLRGPQFTLLLACPSDVTVPLLADVQAKKIMIRMGDHSTSQLSSGWQAFHDLDNTFRIGYGLDREALLLIRPDKYVGFRGSPDTAGPLMGFLRRLFR